jgi:uncharacterized protein YqjF (DUF2071 family)
MLGESAKQFLVSRLRPVGVNQAQLAEPHSRIEALVLRHSVDDRYRLTRIAFCPTFGRLVAMARQRPFLTAEWSKLLLLNFEVPAELVGQLAPLGTEPDLFEGRAYASVVGFLFRKGRLLGLRLPGKATFEEVNLRYYVRHMEAGEVRRGVVFVQEIAPSRIVATVANWFYNQHYVTMPMRSEHSADGRIISAGDELSYLWRTGRGAKQRWNRMAGRAVADVRSPVPGSLEEFVIDHVWAYGTGRDGATLEHRVVRRPWLVAGASGVSWDCDVRATYNSPLAPYLATEPAMAMVADGSAVEVLGGRRLADEVRAPAPSKTRSPLATAR